MRSTVDGGEVVRMQVMSKIIILASKRIKIMTEYEKMLGGEIYDAVDPSLLKDLYACSKLCWEYNQIRPTDFKARNKKLKQILGEADDDTFITPPIPLRLREAYQGRQEVLCQLQFRRP